MQVADKRESYMPAFVRIPLGIFVFLAIAPMFGMLTLPFLIFGPFAAPFALMAIIGDWTEEKAEASELARSRPEPRYRVRLLSHA